VAVLRITVQQDHRLALAGSQIMQPDAVHFGETALDRAGRACGPLCHEILLRLARGLLPSAACAAASRAIGTRNGEQDT